MPRACFCATQARFHGSAPSLAPHQDKSLQGGKSNFQLSNVACCLPDACNAFERVQEFTTSLAGSIAPNTPGGAVVMDTDQSTGLYNPPKEDWRHKSSRPNSQRRGCLWAPKLKTKPDEVHPPLAGTGQSQTSGRNKVHSSEFCMPSTRCSNIRSKGTNSGGLLIRDIAPSTAWDHRPRVAKTPCSAGARASSRIFQTAQAI